LLPCNLAAVIQSIWMRGGDAAVPDETRLSKDSGNPVQGLSLPKESGVYSVLLFLAEFLESGIAA
jgi:hypothetical protein